jgi:hypothetical protein
VGKEKGVDVYLEVRKRRGHIFLNETSACAFSVIVIPFNMKIQSLSLFPYYDTNVNNIELQYTIQIKNETSIQNIVSDLYNVPIGR